MSRKMYYLGIYDARKRDKFQELDIVCVSMSIYLYLSWMLTY